MIRNLASFGVVALACVVLTLTSVQARGQAFNIAPGGFTSTNVCANSNAPAPGCQVLTNGSPNLPQVIPGGILRLNTADLNQHGSAWFHTKQPLSTGFTTAFQFQISKTGHCNGCGSPADGIAMVIQGDPAGTGALGYDQDGQDISYGNNDKAGSSGVGLAITNSLAIELDTYFNPSYSDPDGNHIAVQSCGPNNAGTLTSTSADHNFMCPNGQLAKIALQSLPAPLSLSDGNVHTITVNYLPPGGCLANCNNLTIFFDSVQILTTTIDLTQQLFLSNTASNGAAATGAYIGFTSATGALVENNDILSWSFSQFPLAPITIPEPLQPTNTEFNYSPTLSSGVDYSQSGLPNSAFTGVVMQGTAQAITDQQFSDLVNNTPFQGATCLHQDVGSNTFSCVVTSDLCTTPANQVPAGANCPNTGQNALIGSSNGFNGDPGQKPYISPAYIMAKDTALNCGANADNICKGLLNIFVSIFGDPKLVGRTKDFNSLLLPADGIVAPITTASTNPVLNNGWTNGDVSVMLNSTEVVPANNHNPPPNLSTINSISYTISGANAPTPIQGMITGATGSFVVPGTVEGTTTVTFQALDSAGTNETVVTTTNGQVSTTVPTLPIKVDKTPPTFSCIPPAAKWQAIDQLVPCTASDNPGGSGLATPASFNVSTAVPAGTETNMAQTVPVNVMDVAGNTVSTGSFGPFLVDKKAPVITGPSVNGPVIFGQPNNIFFGCADGGAGVVLCGPAGSMPIPPTANTGTLDSPADVSSAGPKAFTVNSQDAVGNASAPAILNYIVQKATPVITWSTPAPISYGTPLSSTQLNAAANVPGSFVYSPPAGTVLNPGNQQLSVTFTPSDSTDYNQAVAQVMIQVLQPTLTFTPGSVDFGTVYLRSYNTRTIVVANPGTAAVQISGMKVVRIKSDPDDFSFVSNCPKSLGGGSSCVAAIGFLADELGVRTANFVVTDSAAGSPQAISLTANVIKKK